MIVAGDDFDERIKILYLDVNIPLTAIASDIGKDINFVQKRIFFMHRRGEITFYRRVKQ